MEIALKGLPESLQEAKYKGIKINDITSLPPSLSPFLPSSLSPSLPPSPSLSLPPSSLFLPPFLPPSLSPFLPFSLPSFVSPPSSIPLQLILFFVIFFVVAEVFVNGLRRQTSLTKLAQVCLCARTEETLFFVCNCAYIYSMFMHMIRKHAHKHAHNMHTLIILMGNHVV